MQELSGPGAPGDPNRVDLRFGTDAQGELYILAKANGKIWKVVGTRTFAAGDVGDTRVRDTMRPTNWAPVTPSKWRFTGDQVILAEAGVSRPGPRRPFEYAILTAGPELSSVEINAEVRLDTPVEVTNRDVIIVFGWQSDTEFYYAHLSTDNTIYPHNGIFKVNNADRERIEYQWNGRSPRRQPGGGRRQVARREGAAPPGDRRDRGLRRRVQGPADDRPRHDVRLRPRRVRFVRQHRAYA